MAQLIRRIGATLLAITLALLALASPAHADRKFAFDGDAVTIHYGADEFVPIRPSEFLPYEQKQGPPYDLLAQVTTNPSVTGDCPTGTQTVTGITGWVGRCEERSFAVALQNSLIPEEGRGDRTPTFTRATTAYQTDFEGKQNLVLSGEARFQGARRVRNLLAFTETFSNAAWSVGHTGTAVDGVKTNNFGVAPDGTTTAARIQLDVSAGSVGNVSQVYQLVTTQATAATTSWVKVTSGGPVTIMPFSNTGSPITVTGTWQRFNSTVALGGLQYLLVKGTTSDTADLLVWHPQVEGTTGQGNLNPSEYVHNDTGIYSAPFSGAGIEGVQYFNTLNGNTVASNVVTEATGAAIVAGAAGVSATAPVDAGGPYGYLAEGARADVLGTTNAIRRDMSDAGWVATNVTKGTTTGIDGTANSAATLTATAGNGTVLYTTVLGAAVRTYSAWVSRITGTGTINMTKDGSATWTPITLTSTPTQFQVTTASVANPVVGFQIVTSGDAIEVDFNTLEAATFANPTPIPVNVSKAADVLTYSVSANISGTVGTAYVEFTTAANTFSPQPALISGATSGTGSPMFIDAGPVLELYDGTALRSFTAVTSPSSTVQKAATSWGGSTCSGTVGGAIPTSRAFDGDLNLGSVFGIASQTVAAGALFGTIRNVRTYPTALSAARGKAITSDAADWLGSPFWRMAANDDTYRIAVNQ